MSSQDIYKTLMEHTRNKKIIKNLQAIKDNGGEFNTWLTSICYKEQFKKDYPGYTWLIDYGGFIPFRPFNKLTLEYVINFLDVNFKAKFLYNDRIEAEKC